MEHKNTKFKRISVCLVVAIAVIISTIIISSVTKERPIIKDNVIVITEEVEKEKHPIQVSEKEIIFKEKQNFQIGDVLVSGIIESAPDGFIRRVTGIYEKNNEYIVITEPALLTDVFERANISAEVELSEEGVKKVNFDEQNIEKLFSDNNVVDNITEAIGVETVTAASTKKYGFTNLIKYNLTQYLSVSGKVEFSAWLEINIDINRGNIEWSTALHTKKGGEVSILCKNTMSESIEKELFKKNLPNIQIMVGNVPIVITNRIESTLSVRNELEGSIETSMGIGNTNSVGFNYNSKTKKINEIYKKEYLSKGVEWNTEASASANNTCGISVSLITKLYDCTGAKIETGIENTNEAQICLDSESDDIKYFGKIDMEIYPKISGNILVTVPLIDKELANQELFNKKFNPLWEKHWKSSEDWKKEYEENRVKPEWYETYSMIVQDMKTFEDNSKVYFIGIYYAPSVINPPDGRGGVSVGYELNNGELMYLLKDISQDQDGIPELIISTKKGKKVDILGIYTYNNDSRYAHTVAIRDDEYNTSDIYITNDNFVYQGNNSGGEFIMIQEGESMPWSAWREEQDKDRLVDSNTLKWIPIDKWK